MPEAHSLEEYKKNLPEPLRPRTICFLVRDNHVLLGQKKSGLGAGNWVGIGGKVEPGEAVEAAMVREMVEETSVKPTEFTEVATVDFYFPFKEEPQKWNQSVHVFIATSWEGEPKESEEIFPQWFTFDALPFDSMWPDAKHWIPKVLQGDKLQAEFLYDKNLVVMDLEIQE